MRIFPNKYWSITFAVVIVVLLSYRFVIAGPDTLHASSLMAFDKRAAAANVDDWRFVFLGDNRGNDDKFKEALKLAADYNPLFILHGGDIVEKGTATELAHFIKTLHELPDLPPIFIVRGNHETNISLYEKTIGPRNFNLDSHRLGFRLVAVDNVDYSLKEKELNYLTKALDQQRPIQFVSMHIPPKTERWSKHSFTKGKDDLINLMVERKVNLGLFAHIHLYDKDEINGVPCVISGGAGAYLAWFGYSGDASYHIVVVEVKKGKVSYRAVPI